MALLQISEPEDSTEPHARRLSIGIDLGTTHSLVASVRSGTAECLTDALGDALMPSVVRYASNSAREYGYQALKSVVKDPANTIFSAKRLIGRKLCDITEQRSLPYALEDSGEMVHVKTRAGLKSPVEISAEILAVLRQRAEDALGDQISGAVVTVPAYFDDAQRQATKDAAELAGLKLLRLINEPTAAAIAYGLDNALEGLYAVYDLGGGTFDISILRLTKGVFEVVATGGDSQLGGDDFDLALVEYFAREHGLRALTPQALSQLRKAARKAKEALSEQMEVRFEYEMEDGASLALALTRQDFEGLVEPLIKRTVAAAKRTLRDAALDEALLGVVLVGGATRMPCVRSAVQGLFGMEPLTNLNPDEVVALGAAVVAHQLAGNRSANDLLLLDVVPLSLGIETMGGLVERVIERNTTIPVAKVQEFTTFKDGQTAMSIHVVQGERERVSDCRSLARFDLRGIPPMVAGAARIRVSFTVDADGVLAVGAEELGTGVRAQVQVKPSYGLSDEMVARALAESYSHAALDKDARALLEEQVEAKRVVLAVNSALAADADLLSATERASIDAALQALQAHEGTKDYLVLRAATQALGAASDEFAARRMNRSVSSVLAGKKINAL